MRKGAVWFMLIQWCLCLACSGCGQKDTGVSVGEYVEQEVISANDDAMCTGIAAKAGTIRLIREKGQDLLSVDGGVLFREDENTPQIFVRPGDDRIACVTPEGDRLCRRGFADDISWVLYTHDGRELQLEQLGKEAYCECYGGGYFYISQGDSIYRVDPATGKTVLFVDGLEVRYHACMAADSRFLYVADCGRSLVMYDAATGKEAGEQDEKLAAFVVQNCKWELLYDTFLLYPCENTVYILTYQGIYRHELYEGETELVIDGGKCGIGDVSRYFLGMAVTEGKNGPEFWISYSDGCVTRYVRETSLPSVAGVSLGAYDRQGNEQEISRVEELYTLRIYSLYDDGNVRQAISAFRQSYPELYVRYEVGVDLNQGITRDIALQRLEEELAEGRGPDILLMDELPYERYVEKGILTDLSDIRARMTEEEYFLQVIDGLAEPEGLYVMPVAFALPVLYGEKELTAGAESLEQLADLTEEAAQRLGEGEVFSFKSPEELLRLLALSSQGAWMQGEELNREAAAEFLACAKRIYAARKAAEGPETFQLYTAEQGQVGNVLERRFGYSAAAGRAVYETARWGESMGGGFLTGGGGNWLSGGGVGNDFADVITYLNRLDMELQFLPGQCFGDCLAETLLAVNEASARKEESLLFVEYAVSYAFQYAPLNGTPVNRRAYEAMKQQSGQLYSCWYGSGFVYADGSCELFSVEWPEKESWEKLDRLIDGISGVSRCDFCLYEAMVEEGWAVLTGEADIEETLDRIEERMRYENSGL